MNGPARTAGRASHVRARAIGSLVLTAAVAGAVWRASRSGPSERHHDDPRATATAGAPRDCPVREQAVTVRGGSLGELAPNGTALLARFGYYACNPIERGDLVWYRRAGSDAGAAKLVMGVPGDRIALAPQEGGVRLLVNGRPVRTSRGEHYFLDRRARRMLSLYIDGYRGRIPDGAYLLLADRSERVVDSRSFGLVGRSELLARLERP